MSYEQNMHRDVIDLVLAGAKEMRTVAMDDGQLQNVEMPDAEVIYYMTRNVNAPSFSNFVFQIKMLQSLAEQAPYAMSKPRADVIVTQINSFISAFKRAIDAKSSETMRTEKDKQATLIDKIVHHKEEKTLNLVDKSKGKGIAQMFGGGQQEPEQ